MGMGVRFCRRTKCLIHENHLKVKIQGRQRYLAKWLDNPPWLAFQAYNLGVFCNPPVQLGQDLSYCSGASKLGPLLLKMYLAKIDANLRIYEHQTICRQPFIQFE